MKYKVEITEYLQKIIEVEFLYVCMWYLSKILKEKIVLNLHQP